MRHALCDLVGSSSVCLGVNVLCSSLASLSPPPPSFPVARQFLHNPQAFPQGHLRRLTGGSEIDKCAFGLPNLQGNTYDDSRTKMKAFN